MPYSALRRAATRAWGTPSTVKAASGRVGTVGSGPSRRTPSMAGQPAAQAVGEVASWAAMASQPMRLELVDGGVQGDGADHVGRSGLLPLGRVGPGHLVQVDQVDRAAAGQERVAVGEGGAGADQDPGAEGGVHLVAAPGQVVGRGGEGSVGGQLGGVDQHGHAALVGGVDDARRAAAASRSRSTRPVTASSRGRGRRVEGGGDGVEVEGAVGAALDEPARGTAGPRAAGWRGARRPW